jgi:hypothetical protein
MHDKLKTENTDYDNLLAALEPNFLEKFFSEKGVRLRLVVEPDASAASAAINEPSETLKNPSRTSVQIAGQSLESFGIRDGDFLIFDFDAEVKINSFAAIWNDNDYRFFFVESVTAKKIRLTNDELKKTVRRSEIYLLGRVIKMERDL